MKDEEAKIDRWYHFFYRIVWLFFFPFHPVKVIGRENIPEGAAIICPNHTKASDPFYAVFAFKNQYPLRIMAKIEVMQIPVISRLLALVGVFGVDRKSNDIGAIKRSMKILKNGRKLLMFPEGTRVSEGSEVEAKTGAALFSLRTGSPIVPVYIPAKKKWFRKITVAIGEPIQPSFEGKKPTSEDYQRVAGVVMDKIKELKELYG